MSRPLSQAYPYGVPTPTGALVDGPTVHDTNFAVPVQSINDAISDLAGDYDWTYPTLTGSPVWVNYGSGYAPIRYRRWGQYVMVSGLIASGAGAIFTLPVGYRPSTQFGFIGQSNGGGALISVATTGVVSVVAYTDGGNNAYLALDGISFLRD